MQIHKKRIEIKSASEPWCKIELEDGTIIRGKLVFMSVDMHVNERGEPILADNGLPKCDVNMQQIVTMEVDNKEPTQIKPRNNLN
jgi:hypothetical protein